MRNLILFGLFIMLLLAAQFASAKTVDEVIEKYIRARGGKGKLAAVKSIYMEGVKEMMGEEVIVKIMKQQDKLSRTEIESSTSKGFVLITGKDAFTFLPHRSPVPGIIPDEDLAGLQSEMDIAGPLVDYIDKGHKAVLLGKEMVEGNNCYKIKLTTREEKEMIFWLDTATYFVNQSSAIVAGKEAFTVYRNYKEVDGIKFAHISEIKISGADPFGMSGEIAFHKIILNPIIDQKMFLPE